MPIYGRWNLVREGIACFLRQDDPHKRLIILNDAPGHPLLIEDDSIEVINVDERMNLGAKRQFLLQKASGKLVSHFDSDDLYLPTHLSHMRKKFEGAGMGCVKCENAWYLEGVYGALETLGVHKNVFEGQMFFDRDEALSLGGYSQKHSGQALDLLNKFRAANRLYTWPELQKPTYAYRAFKDHEHVSMRKDFIKSEDQPPNKVLHASDFLSLAMPDFDRLAKIVSG